MGKPVHHSLFQLRRPIERKDYENLQQQILNEENFRFLKDRHYLRFEPVYHWTDQKIWVHALMCVLALLMVRLLQYRLWLAGERLSIPLLLEEFDDITEVILIYPSP